MLFGAAQLHLQGIGDSFRDLALDRKDIRQFSIEGVGPEMRVGQRVDQLHIHAHLVVRLLHAAFEDVRITPNCFAICGRLSGELLKCCVDVREIDLQDLRYLRPDA